MRRRNLPAVGFWAALLALSLLSAAGIAQSPSPLAPSAISAAPSPLADLIRQGSQLESEGRWGEAMSFYEEAIRRFPDDRGLERRFELTRLHYNVGRRYGDRSFLDLLGRVTLDQTLDLYQEVLVKIQSHYVEAPDYKALVERGDNDLEVALSEPAFLRAQAPEADARAVEACRAELRRVLGTQLVQTRSDARDAVALAAGLVQQRLGIAPNAVALEFVCGAANALDVYSSYLTPSQLNDVYSQIEGNFVGLGVELKADNGALLIVRVIGGSPASLSGIRPGDRIIAVDGRSTASYSTDQAANLLQGPEGSVVRLAVAGPGEEPRQVDVRRQRVEVPSVDEVRLADPAAGVAYLRLTCFQKTTSRDLDAALWDLHRQGMRSLVMDLRGNPGGLLVTAVDVADKFLEQGVIVSTHGRNLQEDFTYSAHESGTWRVPLVVLIDRDSASAAEIFAGAIRDHRRGTIVGARSYGKGSVQGIFPLGLANAGLRLTTAKFYSPNGRPYAGVGVEPDIAVRLAARPVDGQIAPASPASPAAADPMLEAALQAARQLVVAQR